MARLMLTQDKDLLNKPVEIAEIVKIVHIKKQLHKQNQITWKMLKDSRRKV